MGGRDYVREAASEKRRVKAYNVKVKRDIAKKFEEKLERQENPQKPLAFLQKAVLDFVED